MNTGGPAFPTTPSNHDKAQYGSGMSLRDYFAAKAMQGIFSVLNKDLGEPRWDIIAADSYTAADAMLKARGQ